MHVLFLSRWFPYPADNGSKIRIYNLLRALGEHHQVHLVSFTSAEVGQGRDDLGGIRDICASVQVVPYRSYRPHSKKALAGFFAPRPRFLVDSYNRGMAETVDAALRCREVDLIIASEVDMIPYTLVARGIPSVLEDVELAAYRDAVHEGSRPMRLRAGLTWLKMRSYLRRTLPRFDVCTVVSEQERMHLQAVVPAYAGIKVLPNAVDVARYASGAAHPQPNSLIYCGALTYSANLDAVQHFIADVFPAVRRGAPSARLRVTGATGGADVTHLAAVDGIEFTGYLPDIRPALAESWLSVVPLRKGGGTRLKILESMALGTPVVATSKGAEGLDVTDGENILLADGPREFAQAVLDVLRSPEIRERLAAAGRELVQTRYDWAAVGSRMCDIVARLARPCD